MRIWEKGARRINPLKPDYEPEKSIIYCDQCIADIKLDTGVELDDLKFDIKNFNADIIEKVTCDLCHEIIYDKP